MTIEFILSSQDDSYHAADWFHGGLTTINQATDAANSEEANEVLAKNYRGPDQDGVSVTWSIEA